MVYIKALIINSIRLLAINLIIAFSNSNGINAQEFLKTPAYIDNMTPEWAKEMYSETPNVIQVDNQYNSYYEHNPFHKTIHTQIYKHWRRSVERYIQEDGSLVLPSPKEQNYQEQKILEKNKNLSKSLLQWEPLGPFETYTSDGTEREVSWQANIYTIDQSLTDRNIVYAGTEAGGIFKSTDKGENWSMVSQNTMIRTVRTIKVDPSNSDIVYAGDNRNIYKTTDGGANWTIIMTEGGLNANDLSINPNDPNIILLGSRRGLFRSENAGESWTRIYQEDIWDIELKPDEANVVYILKSNIQKVKTEFWRSSDYGVTFTLVENGWYNSTDSNRVNGGGRMTVTPADPNRIYVILVGASKADDHGYIGIYASRDAGQSWALTDPPVGGPYTAAHPNLATLSNTNTLQQGYYNLGIAASHEDPDAFLVGCLNLWKSTDAGKSFNVLGGYRGSLGWIHPDQQEIEINGSDVWAVSDGGINYSDDFFQSHKSLKKGLNASEWWGFGSGWNEDLVVGGRYHNGNSAHRPTFGKGNFLRLGGGEAPTGYVQPGGQSIAYFSDIDAKQVPFSIDEAARNVAAFSMYPLETYFASNYSELEFSPSCYKHMWLGRDNKLYKSEDNGNTFQLVKAFGLATNPILNFELSRQDDQVLYVYQRTAFYDAVLWVSKDGGDTWVQKSFPNAGSQRSGALMIHAEEPGTLWVSFAHQTNDGSKIFRTDDYGDSWTNITQPILDGEVVNCLFHQAGTENLFLGTNFSMYMYNGTDWAACSTGLPARFFTNRLAPFYKENKLRVATYGNGVWEVDLPAAAAPLAQATVDKRSSDCSRDTFYFDDYSIVEHDSKIRWNWQFIPEPQFISDPTSRNPKVVFGETGSYTVQLTVSNLKGSDTYVHPAMIELSSDACNPDIFPGKAMFARKSGDDYMQLPSINMQTTDFTLMAWVKPLDIQQDYTGIIFNDDDSYGLNFTTDNQLGFHHESAGSAAWSWQSGLKVEEDVWSHVAMVATAEGVTLYLNGIPATRTLDLGMADFGTMKIGSYKGWADRNMNGFIDEVSIWDRALTTEEIRNHRHITKNAQNAEGLRAYYQFNDSSSRILDRVGLKHGVIRGRTFIVSSTAPVGGGTASSVVLSDGSQNTLNFPDEDIELDVVTSGESMLTVSQIGIAPQNNNLDSPLIEDGYWIVNSYGSAETNNIDFLNIPVDPALENNPDNIILFQRAANDSEAEFEWGPTAQSASALTSVISIETNENLDYQLLVGTAEMSGLIINEAEEIKVYPNPTTGAVNFSGDIEQVEITVFDSRGNRVLERNIYLSERVELLDELVPGVYTYLIETKGTLKRGRIVIVN